jgi:hypothetical protein
MKWNLYGLFSVSYGISITFHFGRKEPNCLGSPDPPDVYHCKSRSTVIENSVEITLFSCQCCLDYSHQLYCDDERCDGEEKGRCKTRAFEEMSL